MDENSLGFKSSFVVIHVLFCFFTPLKPNVDSLSFTVLAMKDLMNLARTEVGRRLTSFYSNKMSHPSKSYLGLSVHILKCVNRLSFTASFLLETPEQMSSNDF